METPVPANGSSESRCNSRGCASRTGQVVFFLFSLVAAGFIGAYASKAFAHGPFAAMMHHGSDPARMDQHVEKIVKHFGIEVDATPEQQERLSAIARSAARDLAPLREKMRDARTQALAWMNAESIDRAAIETMRAEQMALMETVSKRVTLALTDAAEVLTPEQRRKLAERMQNFRNGRHHRG